MMRLFYPHQRRAFRYCCSTHTPALFMEMRLGKSAVIIRWAKRMGCRRILLVAPLSTIPSPSWERELQICGVPKEQIHLLSDLASKERLAYVRAHQGWHLLNFEGLRAAPNLALVDWDAVIVDESTRIRNPQARITKLMTRGFLHVRYKAILSGMPRPKADLDVFSQFQFLTGEFCGYDNYWEFKKAKYHEGWASYEWLPNKGTRDLIKAEAHRRSFMLTLKRAGLGNTHVYEARVVKMTRGQKREQNLIAKEFRSRLAKKETKWVGTRTVWLAKLAGGFSPDNQLVAPAKLEELKQVVCDEFAKKPVVVWFRFNHELEHARKMLVHANVKLALIRGATPKRERGPLIEQFQQGRVRVLLMQEQVGQYGLNLSVADVAVYYSNSYDYEVRSQTEKRIEHMAKRQTPLLYIDLVTRGSADEDVVDLLRERKWDEKQFSSQLLMRLAKRLAA